MSSSSNKLSSIGIPFTNAASMSSSGKSVPPQASSRPFSSTFVVSGIYGVKYRKNVDEKRRGKSEVKAWRVK